MSKSEDALLSLQWVPHLCFFKEQVSVAYGLMVKGCWFQSPRCSKVMGCYKSIFVDQLHVKCEITINSVIVLRTSNRNQFTEVSTWCYQRHLGSHFFRTALIKCQGFPLAHNPLLKGGGQQLTTPLAISKQHWNISKIKISQVFVCLLKNSE